MLDSFLKNFTIWILFSTFISLSGDFGYKSLAERCIYIYVYISNKIEHAWSESFLKTATVVVLKPLRLNAASGR